MSNQVKVTSIEVLERFRASVIVFLTKAHNSVDEVGDAIRRMRLWLQNDQRVHWEGEMRRRRKILDQAQQELLSAKLSGLKDSTTLQERQVAKAKAAMEQAEEKLRNVKKWNRDFDHTIEPLMKKIDGMRQFLDHDLPKALAFLLQAQRTLDAYTEAGAGYKIAEAAPGAPEGEPPAAEPK
jgi:DNA repair exonuclease SbcCD ATPase subunit